MESSDECEKYVSGFSGCVHQSFRTRDLAEKWLRELLTAEIEMENIRLSKLYPSSSQSPNSDVGSEEPGPDMEPEEYKNELASHLQPQYPGGLAQEDPIYITSSPPSAPDETVQAPAQKANEIDEDNQLPDTALSVEQDRVLKLVLDGKNVFFTGPAGSGKTLLLRHIKHHLKAKGKGFAVTAPTGVAAELINGVTINSWSGVGKGDKGILEYLGDARGRQTISQTAVASWRSVEVLIVDEVSMVGHCSARGAEKGLIVG